MNSIEQEIIEKFQQLDAQARLRVLDYLEQLETERPLSAVALMKLPPDERQRRVKAAIESSQNEDFEVFEAYLDEDFDE